MFHRTFFKCEIIAIYGTFLTSIFFTWISQYYFAWDKTAKYFFLHPPLIFCCFKDYHSNSISGPTSTGEDCYNLLCVPISTTWPLSTNEFYSSPTSFFLLPLPGINLRDSRLTAWLVLNICQNTVSHPQNTLHASSTASILCLSCSPEYLAPGLNIYTYHVHNCWFADGLPSH